MRFPGIIPAVTTPFTAQDTIDVEALQANVDALLRAGVHGLVATGSAAVGALLAIPLVRFTLHPVLARTTEKSWSDVGSLDEFQNLDAPVKKLVTIEQRDGWRRTIAKKPPVA